jgi:hypothetical protein
MIVSIFIVIDVASNFYVEGKMIIDFASTFTENTEVIAMLSSIISHSIAQ